MSVRPQADAGFAPQAAAVFRDAGVEGALVLRDLGDDSALVYGPGLADQPYLPASTFKMANTLIGLETAVIPDAGFTLPWDGVHRDFVPAWNADHDLASAMEHSVLWYFQEIARRVGEERYQDWLARLDYGNRSSGGGVDRFWVAGDLRISPRQQADFLARLVRGLVPGPAGGEWRDSPVFAARREVPLELLRRAGVVPAAMPPPR